MKCIRIFLLLTFCIGCSSPRKFNESIKTNQCEDALKNIPEDQAGPKLMSQIQKGTGTVFSYALTGGAYTAEVVWDFLAGVTTVTVVCAAPTIALMAASGGRAAIAGDGAVCFDDPKVAYKTLNSPPLGRKTRAATKSWECPNVDGLGRSIREVAGCFSARGGPANERAALDTLVSGRKNVSFFSCLSTPEQTEFNKEIDRLKEKTENSAI